MTTPTDNRLLTAEGWPGGVNNRNRETEPGISREHPAGVYLREAVNADITREGNVLRRKGFTKLMGGHVHSLWGDPEVPYMLAVVDGVLVSFQGPELSQTPLLEVSHYLPVSYAAVNGEVYFSNNEVTGKVDAGGVLRPWGIPIPSDFSVTPSTDGGLDGGDYRVALTGLDEAGGESGASDETRITVSGGAGFVVATPPGDWGRVRVYVSQPDGAVLYRAATVTPGAVVAVDRSMIGAGPACETQYMIPPMPGHIVRHYKGRMYVASGNVVWFTEALRYGLLRPSQGLFLFPGRATLLSPTDDGIFIAYDSSTVFLDGDDPYKMTQRFVTAHGAIEGTECRVPGYVFAEFDSAIMGRGPSSMGKLPVWWSSDSVLTLGGPGGRVFRMTDDRLSLPRYGVGATILREQNGISQILSTLGNDRGVDRLGVGDSVVAEVRRNGIVLN